MVCKRLTLSFLIYSDLLIHHCLVQGARIHLLMLPPSLPEFIQTQHKSFHIYTSFFKI